MKKKTITIVSIILTFAVVASFAVGPMVNTQNPQTSATRPAGPLSQALQEYQNVFENGKDVVITGTITNIVYGNGNRMPVEITVKTSDSTVTVVLGPIWMFNTTQLALNAPVKIQGKQLNDEMIAFQVTFNRDQLVQLRNNEGLPIWARRGSNQRNSKGNYRQTSNHRGYRYNTNYQNTQQAPRNVNPRDYRYNNTAPYQAK